MCKSSVTLLKGTSKKDCPQALLPHIHHTNKIRDVLEPDEV